MKKLLIANRGEIARRILRAGKERGYTVAVIATEDDLDSLVCQEADQVIKVTSFLNATEIVTQAEAWEADFIHPGYGFLSENAEFAALVEKTKIVFVGPSSANMLALGSKVNAKKVAVENSIPTLPVLLADELQLVPVEKWEQELEKRKIFSPFLVKASGGGGGRGMRIVEKTAELPQILARASEEAYAAFHDRTVFVERYLKNPRHIEIQVFGDGKGGGVFWGERECSLQRRHQKVIEEAPASSVDEKLREKMGKASLDLVKVTKYRGAGTVEFLLDEDKNFYFLEMNTRLQVEHPVTEQVYQIDLVQAQFDLAEGKWPAEFPDPNKFYLPVPKGVSLEARILAEDPRNQFLPTPGKIHFYHEPVGEGIRVDSGCTQGSSIKPQFDSMIAKLIVTAANRGSAVHKLAVALEDFVILGCTTNLSFLRTIALHSDFLQGRESTSWIEEHLAHLNKRTLPENIVTLFQSKKFFDKLSFVLQRKNSDSEINKVFLRQQISTDEKEKFSINSTDAKHRFVLQMGEQEIPFLVYYHSLHSVNLYVLGEYFNLSAVQFQQKISGSAQKDEEIRAPMTGKVYEVLIAEGEKVIENQVLFIVESMKMQLEIKATQSAVVTQILVEKGQTLSNAEVMAVLEGEL